MFEEELHREAAQNAALLLAGTDSFAESLSYFPDIANPEPNPQRYLSLVERAAAAVDVPVIASLNAITAGGWTRYASVLEKAGAAAIELNIYHVPDDALTSGREIEQRHIDVLASVKAVVSIPVAVKLEPLLQLNRGDGAPLRPGGSGRAGALQPVPAARHRPGDPDREHRPEAVGPGGGRLPRSWIARLRGLVGASIAASTGVETAADVAAYLLAGADVVMTASSLLRHGPDHAMELLGELTAWMTRKGFTSLSDFRGRLPPSLPARPRPPANGPVMSGHCARPTAARAPVLTGGPFTLA